MGNLNVNASITNVGNGRYVVQVRLLTFDGAVVSETNSVPIEMTGNPAPVVGLPSVTVS